MMAMMINWVNASKHSEKHKCCSSVRGWSHAMNGRWFLTWLSPCQESSFQKLFITETFHYRGRQNGIMPSHITPPQSQEPPTHGFVQESSGFDQLFLGHGWFTLTVPRSQAGTASSPTGIASRAFGNGTESSSRKSNVRNSWIQPSQACAGSRQHNLTCASFFLRLIYDFLILSLDVYLVMTAVKERKSY